MPIRPALRREPTILVHIVALAVLLNVMALALAWRTAHDAAPASTFRTQNLLVDQQISAPSTSSSATFGDGITGVHAYTGQDLQWDDEFLIECGLGNNTPISPLFVRTSAGTGAGAATAVGSTTRPGVCTFTTGTTATGRDGARGQLAMIDFASGNWSYQSVVDVPALSTATDEYALIDGCINTASSINPTAGCWFIYDRGNVATNGVNPTNQDKWEAFCTTAGGAGNTTRVLLDGSSQNGAGGAGSITTVDSPVTAGSPTSSVYDLEIVWTQDTSAQFKINGTVVTTLTTNIPSGANRCGPGMLIIKSAGTTARTYDTDRATLKVHLNAARSP